MILSDLPMRPLCGDVPADLFRLFHRVAAKGGCKGLQDLQVSFHDGGAFLTCSYSCNSKNLFPLDFKIS